MIVICRNAAAFRKSRYYRLLAKLFFVNTILHYIHSKDYSRIFKENSIPNHIFGIETVYIYTVSTNYNRYNGGCLIAKKEEIKFVRFVHYKVIFYYDNIVW